jgi:RimJ/RimL family protein N-acetyltransferase
VQPFTLQSPRLQLLVPGPADVPAIVDACQDDAVQRFTTVPTPYGEPDARFFLDRIVDHGWATGRELSWGIREPGSSLLVGMISIRLAGHDLGFGMSPGARGKGLMTEAVRLVVDWAFEERGLPDVRWEGYVGNDGSAAVARRSGFSYAGVGPGTHPGRDGGHPLCWRGRLLSTDDRDPKPGWPAAGDPVPAAAGS